MSNSVRFLYKTIFNPIFLIRYGYYDIETKKTGAKIQINSYDIEDDYAKSDSFYFKVFNMEHLAEIMQKYDLKSFFNLNKPEKNDSTEPILFSIPKNGDARREYKMPNIYSYLLLAFFVCENKVEFIDTFHKNSFSTSKYFNQLHFNFKTTNDFKQRLLYGGKKILSVDLANYYHSLYTHSIPWIIMGKDRAKKDRKSGFANHLDKIITQCQFDETHGIPTGNLLSRIIAELYMCYVDLKMEEKGYKYSRYVDDISFPYSLEIERENFYKDFNQICREHNLIINERKTIISVFPFVDKNDKNYIFSFLEKLSKKDSVNTWKSKLSNFVDFCISQEASGNKGAIKSVFPVITNSIEKQKLPKKMVNIIFSQTNSLTKFNLFEKILDLSLKDSRLTNRFIDFFERLTKLGFSKKRAVSIVKRHFLDNKQFYRSKLTYYNENHHDQELYQLLLYFVEFDDGMVTTKNNLLKIVNNNTDDFSLCLVSILYLKKKYKIDLWLKEIDQLLIDTHDYYPANSIRMTEKYWLLRYFLYSLQIKDVITKKEINKYCKNKGYGPSTKGYKTELNWQYIKNNPRQNKVDAFYDFLLSNGVLLVHFGKDNSFDYLK